MSHLSSRPGRPPDGAALAPGRLAARPLTRRDPPTSQPFLFTGPQLRADWPFGEVEPGQYDLIMADPPWQFELHSAKGEEKSAQAHYACMTPEAICALPVSELARGDCLLWLWATWPLLPLALRVVEAWGFTYKTGGAWDKKRWGTGYIVRSRCEPFLLATKGAPGVDGRSTPNLIEEPRRQHSRKPEWAYAYAEQMMPCARRLELFSRTPRPGWDAWGDEAGRFQAMERVTA